MGPSGGVRDVASGRRSDGFGEDSFQATYKYPPNDHVRVPSRQNIKEDMYYQPTCFQ